MATMTDSSKVVGGVAYATNPKLNSDTPWSEMAILDLRYGVEHGQSVASLADFLCRSEAEVAEQIEAIGLGDQRKP